MVLTKARYLVYITIVFLPFKNVTDLYCCNKALLINKRAQRALERSPESEDF